MRSWSKMQGGLLYQYLWTWGLEQDVSEYNYKLTKKSKYTLRILSLPAPVTNSRDQSQDYKSRPWVVILENFITPEECEALIELGTNVGYARSTAVDEDVPYAIEDSQTSSNA